MSTGEAQAAGHCPTVAKAHRRGLLRALLSVAVAVAIALLPVPAGLQTHAWYYFALFSAVIAGLVVAGLALLASIGGLVKRRA